MKKRLQTKGLSKVFAFCLIFVSLICFSFDSHGQNISVSGIVKDANSQTIPGVSVIVKGTDTGTTTNLEGKYSIDVHPDSMLVFSSIGYTKQMIPVGGRSNIDVTFSEEVEEMDEFVVVAAADGYEFSATELEEVLRESGDSFESIGNPSKKLIWWY